EDPAQSEIAQEGQPSQPTLLIRAQFPVKRRWCAQRGEGVLRVTGKDVAKPAVGVYGGDREVLVGAAQAFQQDVPSGPLALAAAFQELQRRLEVALVQFHPLAADADQRDLQPG